MKTISRIILSVAVLLCVASPALLAQTVPNWAPNTAYAIGSLVMYQNVEYRCIQAHTSQVGWEPPNVPALWSPVSGNPTPTPTPTDSNSHAHPNSSSGRRLLQYTVECKHYIRHPRHKGKQEWRQLPERLLDNG